MSSVPLSIPYHAAIPIQPQSFPPSPVTFPGSKNTAGFCRDGLNYGLPLHCPSPAVRDDATGICGQKRPGVRGCGCGCG